MRILDLFRPASAPSAAPSPVTPIESPIDVDVGPGQAHAIDLRWADESDRT